MRCLTSQQPEKVRLFTCPQQQSAQQSSYPYLAGNPQSQRNLALFNTGQLPPRACGQQLSAGLSLADRRAGSLPAATSARPPSVSGRRWRLRPAQTAPVPLLAEQDPVEKDWVGQALATVDPAKSSYVGAVSAGLAARAGPAIG